MLRRPATTLTLTPADLAAYETARVQRIAALTAEAKRKQQRKQRDTSRLEARRKLENVSPSRSGGTAGLDGVVAGTGTGTGSAGAGAGAGAGSDARVNNARSTARSQTTASSSQNVRAAPGSGTAAAGAHGGTAGRGQAGLGQREQQARRIFGQDAAMEYEEDEDAAERQSLSGEEDASGQDGAVEQEEQSVGASGSMLAPTARPRPGASAAPGASRRGFGGANG